MQAAPVADDQSAAAEGQPVGEPAAAAVAAAADNDVQPKKQAKRKVAMHVAYLGAGFHGMQRNPGCRTIESELEAALTKAGAISEQNAGSFQKIHWNRAARTDKGVSALCQVVSAKLVVEPRDTFAERVNKHLPSQIRVFGAQRATEGFDARKFCDKRKYEYILPAWVFDPRAAAQGRGGGGGEQQQQQQWRDQRGGMAAAAAGGKKVKVGSSSARLADEAAALQAIAEAVLAATPAEPTPAPAPPPAAAAAAGGGSAGAGDRSAVAGGPGSNGGAAAAAAAAGGGGPTPAAAADTAGGADGTDGVRGGNNNSSNGNNNSSNNSNGNNKSLSDAAVEDERASTSKVGQDVLQRLRQDVAASQQRYVFGEAQLQRLNGLLAQYEGTHNFHNYTVRVSAGDPAARRYIMSFKAELIQIKGRPWVSLQVVGQSFMLHQIRKMVGMVLSIMRNVAPEECLQLALDPDRDVVTPMAPELGLFLDETYFDAYNNRFGELHGPVSFEPYRQAATDFKYSTLYSHIATLDDDELVNALWLRGLSDTYFRFSLWATQPKARDTSKLTQYQQIQLHQQQQLEQQAHLQQQRQANGQDHKRKQEQPAAAAAAGSTAQQQQQQQQQPAQKHQRLERPGKHTGASAAMVVGIQETYGMRPHSDTPQAATFRRELKEMREEFAKAQHEEQQQAQAEEVLEDELDLLYDV